MEDDLLNLTRSVYLQGKTELTDEELAVVLSLPPESQKDFTFNEIYTNKEFKEVRKNPSELNNLKDKLKELPEYLKYKNTYISKSKLYFELSSTLYNEIPCLTILNEINKPAYLLPFSFAQDLNGNKKFADSITKDYFTDFKRVFGDNIVWAFKNGSEQGENIFFIICNENLNKEKLNKQLINRIKWKDRNIDKTAEYIFYDENKAVCYTFLSDKKGTIKELDDIDLKKIRLAISDKPYTPVVSITSPTPNTNNIQNNNDYVNFYFNSNLIKGSLYQYKTQNNIPHRISKYYRELSRLEQMTKILPEGTLKHLNEIFINNEKETSYYKSQEIDNRYFRTLYFGTQEELALLVENRALRMGFTDAIPEQTQTYITRDKPEPKKTIRAYKCFFVDELGRPSALFVGGADSLPQNIWLQAKDVFHFKSPDNDNEYVPTIKNPNSDGGKTGDEHTFPEEAREYLIEHGYIGRDYKGNKVTCVAYRPGWHAGTEPISPQLGILNPEYSEETKSNEYKCIHRYNQVIFEVELDASTDYTDFARSQDKAKTKKGKINPKKADLQHIPENGFYRYATNQYLYQHPELGEWMISSSMKIIRALTQEECDQICKEHGIPVQKWENGFMDLQTLGYDGPEYEAVRKTLAPITYDENGEIIPLSKRFDKTNPDVLHELHYTPQKITEVKIPGIQKSAFEFDENYGEKEQEAERLERLNSLKAIVEAPDFACVKIKTHDDHYILIHKSSRYNDPKESPDTKYQMSWFDDKGAIMHHSAADTEDILSELHSNIGWDEFTAEVMTFDYEKERQLVNAQILEEPNTNYFTAPENKRNRENHQVYETNGLRVDVNSEGKITEQGWKDLSAIMDMYSNKSYETTRYLFVKDGKIIRQTAISCKIPNTTIVDEANSQRLNSYRHYAEDNDCQIIMVHNHPSGDIRPSDADIRENNILLEELKDSSGHNRLMGCVILDHGNMSIFNSENKNWYTCLKGEVHEGFNAFESELYSKEFRNTDRPIVREKENAIAKRLALLASELDAGNTWNTKDFIPVFFLNERNEIKKHEYLSVSEFKNESELKRKLKSLGSEYSSTKLYMLPTNYDNNILCQTFNQRTSMVTDIYCSEPGYINHTLNENRNRIFTNEDLVISESDDSLNYPYFEREVSHSTNKDKENKTMTENELKNNENSQIGIFNKDVVTFNELSEEEKNERLVYYNTIEFKDTVGFNSEYNNIQSKYFNFSEHEDERLLFLKAASELGYHTTDLYGSQRIVEQYLRHKFNLPLIYENGEVIHRTQEELDKYKRISDFINFAAYDITTADVYNLKSKGIETPYELFDKINELIAQELHIEQKSQELENQEDIQALLQNELTTELGNELKKVRLLHPELSYSNMLEAAVFESMDIKVNYNETLTTEPYQNNPMAAFIVKDFVNKYITSDSPDEIIMKNDGKDIKIHSLNELKEFIDSNPTTYEKTSWMESRFTDNQEELENVINYDTIANEPFTLEINRENNEIILTEPSYDYKVLETSALKEDGTEKTKQDLIQELDALAMESSYEICRESGKLTTQIATEIIDKELPVKNEEKNRTFHNRIEKVKDFIKEKALKLAENKKLMAVAVCFAATLTVGAARLNANENNYLNEALNNSGIIENVMENPDYNRETNSISKSLSQKLQTLKGTIQVSLSEYPEYQGKTFTNRVVLEDGTRLRGMTNDMGLTYVAYNETTSNNKAKAVILLVTDDGKLINTNGRVVGMNNWGTNQLLHASNRAKFSNQLLGNSVSANITINDTTFTIEDENQQQQAVNENISETTEEKIQENTPLPDESFNEKLDNAEKELNEETVSNQISASNNASITVEDDNQQKIMNEETIENVNSTEDLATAHTPEQPENDAAQENNTLPKNSRIDMAFKKDEELAEEIENSVENPNDRFEPQIDKTEPHPEKILSENDIAAQKQTIDNLNKIVDDPSIMPTKPEVTSNLDPVTFLQEALKLKSQEEYKQFYDTYFTFDKGQINQIPPIADNQIGLFVNDSKEPVEIMKGSNANRKALVEKCINDKIALFYPTPDEVMEEGFDALKNCLKQYEFYLNRPLVQEQAQGQDKQQEQEQTPLTESFPKWWQEISDEKIRDMYNMDNLGVLVDFAKEPYTIGGKLPPISSAKTVDGVTTLIEENDWVLDRVNNNDSSVTITRMNNGIREFKKLDKTYYEQMIKETQNYLNSLNTSLTKKQHLERAYEYEDRMGINQDKLRENSAAQFWHNFEVRCKAIDKEDLRNPAGNLYDAIDVAKELYSKMSPSEKKKMKHLEKTYKKETGQSYQEHLEKKYNEIMKGREIKDFDVYDRSSLTKNIPSVYHNQSILDDNHKLPEDLNLKIGDTVKLGIQARDFKGRKKMLPPTDMEIKNVSKETNTVVLYDNKKKARYDIPLDTFVTHQREVNIKLNKEQEKMNKKVIKHDKKLYGGIER